MKFGLALSGGGAKGAAHVGVLMALYEQGIVPDVVAGTSAGSIVAGCLAAGMTPGEIREEVTYLARFGSRYLDPDYLGMLRFIPQLLHRRPTCLKGFLKGNRLLQYLCYITEGKGIEDSALGILIPAVDLYSGRTVIYTNQKPVGRKEKQVSGEPVYWEDRGMLCRIMMASSSFPGIFCPRSLDGRMLVDGGVTYNLPTSLLAAVGVKRMIGVDVGKNLGISEKSSVLDVVTRSFSIRGESLERCHSQEDALILRPKLPETAGLLDFSSMTASMEAGYDYTIKKLPAIREKLDCKKSF